VAYDPARPPQTVAAGISTTLDRYWSATLGSAARSSVATSRINAHAATRATSTLVGPREFEKSAGAAEADRVA
jgi:hypothetical protein